MLLICITIINLLCWTQQPTDGKGDTEGENKITDSTMTLLRELWGNGHCFLSTVSLEGNVKGRKWCSCPGPFSKRNSFKRAERSHCWWLWFSPVEMAALSCGMRTQKIISSKSQQLHSVKSYKAPFLSTQQERIANTAWPPQICGLEGDVVARKIN